MPTRVSSPKTVPARVCKGVCLFNLNLAQITIGTRMKTNPAKDPKRNQHNAEKVLTAAACPLIFHLSVIRKMADNCAIAAKPSISRNLGG